jgi:hypothetical protein
MPEERQQLYVLPSAVERILLRRWIWIVLVPEAIWVVSAASMVGKPAPWPGGVFTFTWFLGDQYANILTLGLFAGGFFFAAWVPRVSTLADELVQSGVLRRTGADETSAALTLAKARFQRWLASPFRYAVILATVAFSAVAMLAWQVPSLILWWIHIARERPMYWPVAVFMATKVVALLIWSYGAGAAIWIIGCASRHISELPRVFRVDVKWGHADRCGGLRPMGRATFGAAACIAIGGAIASGWLLVPDSDPVGRVVGWSALLLFVVPLTAVAFVAPLWTTHETLLAARDAYARQYSERLDDLLRQLDGSVTKASAAETSQLSERLSALKLLDPDTIRYPEWPFDRTIVTKLALSQLLSLATAAAKLWKP